MMWLVRIALRRPYTMAVAALLILLMGVLSASTMLVDIFPAINIPVVMVAWNYPGLSPLDMERRLVIIAERAYSTTVNGIERIESDSIPGVGLMKIYFEPTADIGAAIAQVSSVSSTILHIVPPGTQPPNVVQFNASDVPVVQMTLSGTLNEQQLYDYGLNFIRVKLFTIPGLSTPAPFGGRQREIMVYLDPQAMSAKGLSPQDIVNALLQSNVIVPAGLARMGHTDYNVLLNGSPNLVSRFNQLPVKVVNDAEVLLGDVGHVTDSYAVQENMVHVGGKRAAYLAILRHAGASTIRVVDAVRAAVPQIEAVAPRGLKIRLDFDQSVFVRGAIKAVIREAAITSILISLMILFFLGSWRSMVIVSTSIPLSILMAVVVLDLTGNSLNLMTLGGLALAVGMLVDDATVEVENIHRNRALGKPLTVAILDSASQVATPAIVATLAICIVFFPVTLLSGPAQFLFTSLALAVVAAMITSYLLSRTLVTTMSRMLMASERHIPGSPEAGPGEQPAGILHAFGATLNRWRDQGFAQFQNMYGKVLETILDHRAFALLVGGAIVVVTGLVLVPAVGMDLFPTADVGLMRLHFRAPAGTRIEDTERLVLQVEDRIRQLIPPRELNQVSDMIGVPTYFNLAFVQTDNIGEMDADILVSLQAHHRPTTYYQRELRRLLPGAFPGCSFYFEPADIVSQVLNFGLSAPIDLQVTGPNYGQSVIYARRLFAGMRQVPGAADVHIKQVLNYPALMINVDRQRAAQLGLSQNQVASSLLVSLSSSSLVSPSYFLNPQNNVNYIVAVQVPFQLIHSVPTLLAMPLSAGSGSSGLGQPIPTPQLGQLPEWPSQTLSSIAHVHPEGIPEEISHYTVQRVIDIEASVAGRDLEGVSRDILHQVAALGKLPPGMLVTLRGQYETMISSFRTLALGLILAIVLVYFLMVVLFQSWLDPFIIMMAVPGALVGIIWMLALTQTTLNVESLMGSIMAVGIATSNSILLVSFANDVRVERGLSPIEAAIEAGKTRLRPVLMTALAMIMGMIPMALAMGEAGEQNAPLGRAVIGGLIVATAATLLIVPVIYSLLRRKMPTKHLLDERFRAEVEGEQAQRRIYDEFGG
jgi:multidrug efflux pump subunit AcrB